MQKSTLLAITTFLSFIVIQNSYAQSNGFTDLKNALERLQGTNHLSAELESTTISERGEGDDKRTTKGHVKVWLEDDPHGLQVLYSNDVLSKMETEAQLKLNNEDAKTQTLNEVDRINATELHLMLSASSSLLRDIKHATFIDEKAEQQNGKSLRLLRFTLPMEFIIEDKEVRGYVKEFEANYLVWIDDNGIPTKSQVEFYGKGRAYIFFKITASGKELSQYQVIDNRLVVVRTEQKTNNKSTFGTFARSAVKTLEILGDKTDVALGG